MRMGDAIREAEICRWLNRIERSPLSVDKYFSRHRVPFSRAQYFRYRKQLGQEGKSGLRDRRSRGNHRLLDVEAEAFVKVHVAAHPEGTLRDLQSKLQEEFAIEMSRAGIGKCLRRLRCSRRAQKRAEQAKPAKQVKQVYTACGGFELIVALACHFGWPEMVGKQITDSVKRFGRSKQRQSKRLYPDQRGRNRLGQFTAKYNRRRDVRENRFASVEEKRESKRLEGMAIASAGTGTLARKCLAALALPLVTNNGMSRSVNTPLGNALLHLCGVNYRQSTLNKFLAELKYLGIAEQLLCGQVRFWKKHWGVDSQGVLELPVLCYYVDGNTKALWSNKRVRQNKVTMLGRVMGCLEQVFVHDSYGRPMYFETYSGHAPVGEYVLSLFEKIEKSLEGSGPALHVNRAIVMDGAGNSVRTLRAFAAQKKYHYITTLDDNQWDPRKVRRRGRPVRYRYGEATLRDSEMELEDSREDGYLVVSRAIEVEWDYGKRTVLLTSLPGAAIGPGEVVKAYFDRWPHQELPFREMKAVANLHRVAGYGKQELTDKRILEKQRELEERIARLREDLIEPLEAIAEEEKGISSLVRQERPFRARSRIVDGRRVLPKNDLERLEDLGRKIRAKKRRVKLIEKPHVRAFRGLRKAEREWLHLQGKETVYKADVELDQIMTFFRVSLVNLYTQLARLLFEGDRISLSHLVQRVLFLPAVIRQSTEGKEVILEYNDKDPRTMLHLEKGLQRINALGCRTLEGKRVTFKLSNSSLN